MNLETFKQCGLEAIGYIVDYKDSIRERFPIPQEEPGFMKKFISLEPPENADKWENLMQDLEDVVMPGLSHWYHPNFNAYYPTGACNVSLLGSLLSGALSTSGDKWIHSPASTELELITLDWFATALGLPDKFKFYAKNSKGGGAFQASASECSFLCIIAAQQASLEKLKSENPTMDDQSLLSLQTAYCSKEAHSSIDKNCLIAMTNLRKLEGDEYSFSLRGSTLEEAIEKDIQNGFKPFLCVGTFGSTSSSALDNINELGLICKKYRMWFHVDGAYAISGLVCPEFRHLAQGMEYANSLNVNASKWCLVHFDTSLMFVDDRAQFVEALNVSELSMQEHPGKQILDFQLWGTVEKRRFRSIKLWFMLRCYGIEGLQHFIRNHVKLANIFADLVQSDERFELVSKNFGLVCFRLKSTNEENVQFLAALTATKKIYMVPTTLKGKYSIRYTVTHEYMTEELIKQAWEIIISVADSLGFGSKRNSKDNN